MIAWFWPGPGRTGPAAPSPEERRELLSLRVGRVPAEGDQGLGPVGRLDVKGQPSAGVDRAHEDPLWPGDDVAENRVAPVGAGGYDYHVVLVVVLEVGGGTAISFVS
jgi:hypothetical protein